MATETQCAKCGRALKTKESVERGYGPICWGQKLAEEARAQREAEDAIQITPSITDGYAGARGPDGSVKVVRIRNGRQEPLRHLVLHSPSGFEWGYGGSGPADLARSIVGDVLGTDDPEPEIYQAFKWQVIAVIRENRWEIELNEICVWLYLFFIKNLRQKGVDVERWLNTVRSYLNEEKAAL